jgi:drug/metabolite transporter (DMT)-like permease
MNGESNYLCKIGSSGEEKPHFSCQDLFAFLVMVLSLFFWFISYIYANEKDINFIDTTLIRGLGICSVNFIVCLVQGYELDLKENFSISKIFIRNSIMVLDAIVFAIVQFYLPLPIVHAIGATGIIFIFILDYLINNIRINKTQAIGISVGMIGIFLTISGKFIL